MTKKAGPNYGRFFIKCEDRPNQQCRAFFEWDDTFHLLFPNARVLSSAADGHRLPHNNRDCEPTFDWNPCAASPDDYGNDPYMNDVPESNVARRG